jgi:hypothetical protein
MTGQVSAQFGRGAKGERVGVPAYRRAGVLRREALTGNLAWVELAGSRTAMADQIFVTRKMVRTDVAVAMETETESFVDGAKGFAIGFTVQTQIRAT